MLSQADRAALLAEHLAHLETLRRLGPPGIVFPAPGRAPAGTEHPEPRDRMRGTVLLILSLTALHWFNRPARPTNTP